MIVKLTFDGDWTATATATGEPLSIARASFSGTSVCASQERERFQLDTFGSQDWLWDTPDEFRFDPASRELVGAEFHVPGEAADPEDSARVPATPAVQPGGLRADEARDFRLEVTWSCAVLRGTPR